jgi:polysaccharide export outer membrane protein
MAKHGIRVNALSFAVACAVSVAAGNPDAAASQQARGQQTRTDPAAADRGSTAASAVRPDYIIGPDDVLTIVFWRDKDMSGDVVVRPDGKISVPLLREIEAAGSTPEQLRARLVEAATRYLEEPDATVVVKEIRSRNVFITGNVAKPGTYPLTTGMKVLQCIALAGGVLEYADTKNIVVIRNESGRQQYHKFNYNDVIRQKRTEQNRELKPGDTIVVP